MKTGWTREQGTGANPEQFTRLNTETYIQRRDIVSTDHGWECESRTISADVYDEIQEQISLISQVVNETTEVDKYTDGYDAAVILLGGE